MIVDPGAFDLFHHRDVQEIFRLGSHFFVSWGARELELRVIERLFLELRPCHVAHLLGFVIVDGPPPPFLEQLPEV